MKIHVEVQDLLQSKSFIPNRILSIEDGTLTLCCVDYAANHSDHF